MTDTPRNESYFSFPLSLDTRHPCPISSRLREYTDSKELSNQKKDTSEYEKSPKEGK